MMAGGGGSIINNIPPGFCFSPTDEELIVHFLYSKASLPFHPNIIPDLDNSHPDPWQLNGKAFSSGNQHYFFSKMKEKYRTTENGYWKEIGVTKPIFSSAAEKKVGIKKYLVFNLGDGTTETNWVMEEYHIFSSALISISSASCYANTWGRPKPDQNRCKWVLCRVYEKTRSHQSQQGANYYYSDDEDDSGTELSWLDEVYLSLDDADDLDEINKPA